MDTLNERIKTVRKNLGLSQKDFAEKIGISQRSVSWGEQPGNNVPDITIKALCMAFRVNEDWLRNGNGEMLLDFTEDEFTKAANMLSKDAFVRSLIVEYWKLDEENKKLFRNFIHKLSDDMKNCESGKNNSPGSHNPGAKPPALSIDEKVELYRKELELEEKAEGKSKALRGGA